MTATFTAEGRIRLPVANLPAPFSSAFDIHGIEIHSKDDDTPCLTSISGISIQVDRDLRGEVFDSKSDYFELPRLEIRTEANSKECKVKVLFAKNYINPVRTGLIRTTLTGIIPPLISIISEYDNADHGSWVGYRLNCLDIKIADNIRMPYLIDNVFDIKYDGNKAQILEIPNPTGELKISGKMGDTWALCTKLAYAVVCAGSKGCEYAYAIPESDSIQRGVDMKKDTVTAASAYGTGAITANAVDTKANPLNGKPDNMGDLPIVAIDTELSGTSLIVPCDDMLIPLVVDKMSMGEYVPDIPIYTFTFEKAARNRAEPGGRLDNSASRLEATDRTRGGQLHIRLTFGNIPSGCRLAVLQYFRRRDGTY